MAYRELDQSLWRTVMNVPAREYTEYQISLDVRAVRSAVVVPHPALPNKQSEPHVLEQSRGLVGRHVHWNAALPTA
ncbi:Type VI secretion lipoprotein/VasD [Pseudomonas brassicacearum]|nr:Type VI secretion lipoprotein/VasD [Pseudomonas brassicacearum]